MITLYQFEISPFCDKIRRILNVKRVPYSIYEVGLIEAQTSYRKTNPTGKCPAIADGERIICDSTDIAWYLEEKYPEPAIIPADARERAWMHVLEDWADESLYFYEARLRFGIAHNLEKTFPKLVAHENTLLQMALPYFVPRVFAGQLNSQGIGKKSVEQLIVDLGRHLDAIQSLLDGHEFLVGDALSLADISVYVMLFCIADSREGRIEVDRRPGLVGFMERVDEATASRDA